MIAAAILVYLWLFYGMFVLVMGAYRAHLAKRLIPLTYALLGPWVVIGALMDVASNLTIFTVIFFEFPRELLVTTRLKRYMSQTGWRWKAASFICEKMLDPMDPTGDHC